MAMHIEQPASRHSAPAARKTSSRPSFSACRFTCWMPGTTITRTPAATVRSAQDRRREAEVADPAVGAAADEDHVDRLAEDRLARLESMYSSARSSARAGARVRLVVGVGTRPVIGMPMPGLVP